jgi:tripartite-type tricarboxylate transporter receptor subunit TctC
MYLTRIFVAILPAALAVLSAASAHAQPFPAKPIRMLTTAAGGGLDFGARVVAQALSGLGGQPVVVENRPGALSVEALIKAPADGYTLLYNANTVWLLPFMRDDVPWDPMRDFAPITLAAISPNLIVVNPFLPVKTVKDLIALAKARPGQLNYASGNRGSSIDLAAEVLKVRAGINIVRIAYRGDGPALNDLVGGHIQISFSTASGVSSLVKSGKVRALAVTTLQPTQLVPGLPTVAAAGLPGFEAAAMQSIFAPAGTPAAIVSTLNTEIVRVLSRPDVKERYLNAGSEAVGLSVDEFSARIKSEMVKWGKIIKDAGIRAE